MNKSVSSKGKPWKQNGLRRLNMGRLTYLTKEEVDRFFQAIPKENARDRLLFDLIYTFGLRRQEVAFLRN